MTTTIFIGDDEFKRFRKEFPVNAERAAIRYAEENFGNVKWPSDVDLGRVLVIGAKKAAEKSAAELKSSGFHVPRSWVLAYAEALKKHYFLAMSASIMLIRGSDEHESGTSNAIQAAIDLARKAIGSDPL